MLLLVTGLALGYHGLLTALDGWVFPWPPLPLGYYVLNGGTALGLLLLALGLPPGARWGRAVVPLVIGGLSLVPLWSTYLLVPTAVRATRPLGGPLATEGLVLRLLPVLGLALVLTAVHYHWPQVVGYCLGLALVQLGWLVSQPTPGGLQPATVLGGRVILPPFINQLALQTVQTLGLLVLGTCISLLMHRLRAQQAALDSANQQLRAAAGTLENLTISRERNRVARELHDTLAHTLSGLSLQLEAADAYWAVDPARAQALLHKAQHTARQGLQDTRHALTALRASPLDDLGLGQAVRQLAAAAAARAGLTLDLILPDPLPLWSGEIEQCLYRVTQEAVANVIYHAAAQHLTVAVTVAGSAIQLVIRDDGLGFAPARPMAPGHFGLAGMHERARLVGGHLTIQSSRGTGTTVCLAIPAGVADPGRRLVGSMDT